MGISYRSSASFGKRMEYWIIGQMLREGLDVYLPLVDDNAIDAVVRRKDGTYVTVQIKARSSQVKLGSAALFAAIPHELRKDYWFVLHSERLNLTWIMTSEEFIREARQNKSGKNEGKRTLWLNGTKLEKTTGQRKEYCRPRYEKYLATNFDRLLASD